MIYHIVTSFVAFNIESQNYIQYTNMPWVSSSLNRLQYESLFDTTSEMQEVIDKGLHIYLSEILGLLCDEKSSAINNIDSIINNIGSNDRCNKRCLSCNEQNIDNRKQTCPKCKSRLPTLAELPKQNVELEKSTTERSTVFKSYDVEKETQASATPKISVTQKASADHGVNVPEIFVPDPLNINPNSTANIEKVLLHIEEISGIKDGKRKWIVVTCDGIPYHRISKIKTKYPWLILIPGQLHEEMNML